MAPVPMTFASLLYDRMISLATGEVRPKGLDLTYIEIHHPRDVFDRMAGISDLDASEFSSSEFITRYASGDTNFVAIPVFPSRSFRHSFITVNSNKVKQPSDLNGARIGVPLYTMTAAVWQRGLLQHEYGIDLSTIEWVEGKLFGPGNYGKPSALPPLKPVKITLNSSPTQSLSDLLVSGELDAIIGADPPPCLGKVAHIRRLFPDFKTVEKRYYKSTGIFPIMHLVAIRRDFYEKHRFVASSLFEALRESKDLARKRQFNTSALRTMDPWLPQTLDDIIETFGTTGDGGSDAAAAENDDGTNGLPDCWPYGVEENRKALEALVQYLYEQSMIPRPISVDELFVPVAKTRFKLGLNDSIP